MFRRYSLHLDIVYPFAMMIALRMDTLFPNRGSIYYALDSPCASCGGI